MKTNNELQNDVMAEIKWDPLLQYVSNEIGIAVKDGVVTLSGLVDTYSKKLAAERAAQRVQGVKVVAVDLEVKLGSIGKRTDIEIAETIKNALHWNNAVNEDKIEIKVDNGWVYLEGTVNWEFEKRNAQTTVEYLFGVRGVSNTISVKSKPIDVNKIKNDITAAFHRNATIDSSEVKLDVSGSCVTLHGTVSSWTEKESAERAAWSSPGVLIVDNQIEIDT